MQAANQLIGATVVSWLDRHPVIIVACRQITHYYAINRHGWSMDIGGGKFVQQQQ